VAFIFLYAAGVTGGKSTAVKNVGLKDIDESIARVKSDIEAKKRESGSIGRQKNEDD
jgi:hypothetical protein